MPDIGPQRIEPPIQPGTVPVNFGSPSAHPAVLGAYTPPWANLLPRPASPSDMISGAELQAKLQQTSRANQGNNAIAQLFQNPQNLDANGMLKPEALAQVAAQGFVPQYQAMLNAQADLAKTQADIQRARMSSMEAGQKFLTEQQNRLLGDFEPLVAEYDADKAKYGPEEAQRRGQQRYSELVQQAKTSGIYSPQILQRINPSFDPERLRANIMGLKGIQDRQDKQNDFTIETDTGRTPAVQYRKYRDGHLTDISGNAPYTPTGIAETKGAEAQRFKGKDDKGNEVVYHYGPSGAIDDKGEPVDTSKLKGIVKVGTKAEESPEDVAKPTGPEDKHGQEYLEALPASRAALVKGYAEGRVAFPGSFSLRSPYWQKMVADITQYDPSFDAVNYNARAATRKDFTSGKSAQNITSFNTAIGHLGSLEKAAEALNNTNYPKFNTLANWIISNEGDPRVVKFNTAKQAVADELTRAFRGTGGNVADIKGWEENLNAANSPEQLRGAVKQAVDLLRSRIEAVGQQYRRGMGTTADVMDLLTPSAKKTLASLPGGEDLAEDKQTTVPPQNGPQQPSQNPVATGKLSPGSDGIYSLQDGQDWKSLPPNSRFRLPGDPPDKMRIRP